MLRFEEKEDRLRKIILSRYPNNPNLAENHEIRVKKAIKFLNELRALEELFGGTIDAQVLDKTQIEKLVSSSRSVLIDLRGNYCRFAAIKMFPSNEIMWVVYTDSLKRL